MTNPYCESLAALRNASSHYLKEVGDQWRTPDTLFWGINAIFGPLMLDLFADDSNAKCPVWYTAEDNALTQDWSEMLSSIGGAAFGNPPYSRSQYHEKQKATSAFFAGAIAVFDKTWRGEKFSYINRTELEAKGQAFMALAQFAIDKKVTA